MREALTGQGRGNIDGRVLRLLVRELVAKGVLTQDEVRALLFDVAKQIDEVGSPPESLAASNRALRTQTSTSEFRSFFSIVLELVKMPAMA